MGRIRKFVVGIPLVCSIAAVGRSLWTVLGDPLETMRHSDSRVTPLDDRKVLRKLSEESDNNKTESGNNKTYNVEVFVQFDKFSTDTSWNLTEAMTGKVLSQKQGESKDSMKSESIITPVAPGTYTFELFDAYGDGLCCMNPQNDGYYKLVVNGQTLALGGEFADTTGQISFKVDADGSVELIEHTVLGLQRYCLVDDPTRFDICLYMSLKTSGFRHDWVDAFYAAKQRWEAVIVGDPHPAVDMGARARDWQVPDKLDDILISGQAAYIDGPYNILGSSGPRTMTVVKKKNPINGNYFKQTLTGEMTLDSADIPRMMMEGSFKDVIVHEMGHVLGFGTMWTYNNLHSGNISDPVYNGINAKREYKNYGFPGELEVEIHHGEGTAGGHWDEECLRTEIMTGIADLVMPLSRVTIGGMEDLGFAVNYSAGDDFIVPRNAHCGQNDPNDPGATDTRVRQLTKGNRRRLSHEGRAAAKRYGEALLAKSLEEKDNIKLAKNEIFVAHEFRSVLFAEGGHIYSVDVRGSDRKSKSRAHVKKEEPKKQSIYERPPKP